MYIDQGVFCANLPCAYIYVALVEILAKLCRVPRKLYMYLIYNPIIDLLLTCVRVKILVKRIINLMHIDSFYIYKHIFEYTNILKLVCCLNVIDVFQWDKG